MEEALTEDDSQTVPSRPVTTMVVSAACGLVFGFAIEKGKGKWNIKITAVVAYRMTWKPFTADTSVL